MFLLHLAGHYSTWFSHTSSQCCCHQRFNHCHQPYQSNSWQWLGNSTSKWIWTKATTE
jgi:hypothetical protein